jgi:lipopolysaccharide/colanic/teichoic acid biosynthesis glycosyltransferase
VPVVPRRQGRHLKTAFDLVVAGSLIVLLAPVLLLLALLVRCTSRGPVLFRQTRIGLEGRPFTILKFRSMRVGAEREVDALRTLNEAGGPLFKIRRDPRLTPVGRWMRRLSLDELPQLFNVLSGSMSLVGPRPALPEEVAAFTPGERGRLAVKPGLTGLAQVSGRSDLPWPEVVALDLVYVAGRTLRTDLRILARTVPAVLTGRGAY